MKISVKPFVWAIASLSFLGFATQSLADKPIYVGKASTGEPVYFNGARFQCGDLPRTDECWSRTPMISYKIGKDNVTAIGDCKKRVFKTVTLGDKTVAQNMRPQSAALWQVLNRSCHSAKYSQH